MRPLFILLCTACSLGLNAQVMHEGKLCGNTLFSDIVRTQYPDLQDAFDETFDDVSAMQNGRRQDPLTIQVIVHVVWKTSEENLHDSVILDQIRVLNEDFNRLNADATHTRDLYSSVAGQADIHFELAEIVRTQTTAEFDISLLGTNLLSEVKRAVDGGSDAWDTEQYLNIWVCKIQPIEIFGIVLGQVLGFAFPPNNLANWPPDVGAPAPEEDGVVIDYRVVGSNNPNVIEVPGNMGFLNVRGRTPVHEVGHYLGLRHIWGDGGLLGPNDCAQSDGISDTPFANAQSPFDCDTTRNSCNHVELFYGMDMPDMIENYMDYSDEGCMNLFTQGQIDHMRNVLLGPRVGLLGTPASVVGNTKHLDFSVWPNPATSEVFVEPLHANEPFDIMISTIDGIPLIEKKFNNGTPEPTRIATRNLAPGIYLLEVRSGMSSGTRKIVVR
jgi:hypothetical protein